MTLVYAEKTGLQIRVWSDTAVTNREAARRSTVPGILKSMVLSPEVCVSFAGSVTGCLDKIRRVVGAKKEILNFDEILQGLIQHNRQFQDDSAFLVAHQAKIFRIMKGNCHEVEVGSWIGDPEAADEFLKTRGKLLQSGPSDPHDPYSENCMAFRQLVSNSEFDTVGGLSFLVERGQSGYIYQRELHVTGSTSIPSGAIVRAESGGAAIGGYSHTRAVPKEPGIPCAGIYFPPGKVGYLYRPLEADEAIEIPDVSWDVFLQRAEDQCGVPFYGM